MSVTLCVLLWARPGQSDALSSYEDRVLKLLAEHGGRVLQRGRLEPGGAPDAPAEVQFLEFPSQAALDAAISDPRRTAMAAEREAVIASTDIHRISLR